MDTRTGDTYPSAQAALDAGVPIHRLVEVTGTKRAIRHLKKRMRMKAKRGKAREKAIRKAKKRSRRANRK